MLPHLLLQFCILIFSITIHEFSHGWVAYRLGDPTARYLGRLSLNPIRHIDPFGTVLLPLILITLRLPAVGWARPVPINFSNLKHPKRDMFWVGLSGPFANIILALFFTFILKVVPLGGQLLLGRIIVYGVIINVVLAVFNLIPIPPLDGSRIVTALLPWKYAVFYSMLEPFGFFIVIILLWSGVLRSVLYTLVALIIKYLGIGI